MDKKKLLIGLFALGAGLAATGSFFRRSNSGKSGSRVISSDAIGAYLEREMSRLHIPGASLAIVEGNQIVRQHSFGRARPGGEAPSPQTPFFIGSLTKSITALAVMQLVEAGKVELDAPIQCYLAWFHVENIQASAQMTVRHLLNQTSGLPSLPGELVLTNFDNSPDAIERQVRALSTLKLANPVGAKCEYSNLNYNILGLIVEVASGESYADYIKKHIFTPLEMRHSYTSRAEATRHGLAMGHRHWFSFPFPTPNMPVPRGSLPSGQLISCAEDMAHYLIAHLNGGRYKDVQILSTAGIAELHRGVKEYIAMGISGGKYGMGWFEIDLGQAKTFSHAGNVPDFSAFMAIVPEQKKGLILLLNADPYGLPPVTGELGLNLTTLLTGQSPTASPFGFTQFLPWLMRLLPLIPLLQVVGVAATLRRLYRWCADPASRPTRGRLWGEHVLLPLVPNLSLAAMLAYLQSTGLIRFMGLFMPDLAWIIRISGGLAAIWSILRTILIVRTYSRRIEN